MRMTKLVICTGYISLSSNYPWSPFSIWELWSSVVVSLLEGMGVAGVVGFFEGGKWKALENSVEQWCKLLLFSQLFTSSLISAPAMTSLCPPPSFHPSPHLPHPFLFSSPSPFFSIPFSLTPLHILPSTFPYSFYSLIFSSSTHPSIYLNLRGAPVASICMW